jgi:hypothetical protein
MYASTAAGSASATGAALVGGAGLAGSASVLPVAGHPSGVVGGALAFTGPAVPYVQLLMLALLVISLGLMLVHASRLRGGMIVTGAAVFKR